MKSNLEPIEENDLDFESKLGLEKQNISNEKINPFGNIEQEIPKEISAAEKDGAYGKILAKVQTQANDDIDHSVVVADAEAGSLKMDAESQVQHLVDIATQKGVVHAVKVAQHMQDNYVLDTFHDRMLGEELHDALLAKGMIKEL